MMVWDWSVFMSDSKYLRAAVAHLRSALVGPTVAQPVEEGREGGLEGKRGRRAAVVHLRRALLGPTVAQPVGRDGEGWG